MGSVPFWFTQLVLKWGAFVGKQGIEKLPYPRYKILHEGWIFWIAKIGVGGHWLYVVSPPGMRTEANEILARQFGASSPPGRQQPTPGLTSAATDWRVDAGAVRRAAAMSALPYYPEGPSEIEPQQPPPIECPPCPRCPEESYAPPAEYEPRKPEPNSTGSVFLPHVVPPQASMIGGMPLPGAFLLQEEKKEEKEPCKPDPVEKKKWDELAMEDSIKKYFEFWLEWLGAKMGKDDDKDLGEECKKRWICIIRAVSWAESVHATGTGNQPKNDPMQSGNPTDKAWEAMKGITTGDRPFTRGAREGAKDFKDLVDNLEEKAKSTKGGKKAQEIPDKDDVMKRKSIPSGQGHNDASYDKKQSFFWGIIWLIYKTNHHDENEEGKKTTWAFGDCSWKRLIRGAIAYNGGGDIENYERKIREALKLSCCHVDEEKKKGETK